MIEQRQTSVVEGVKGSKEVTDLAHGPCGRFRHAGIQPDSRQHQTYRVNEICLNRYKPESTYGGCSQWQM